MPERCNYPTCSVQAGHGSESCYSCNDSGLHCYKDGHFCGNRQLRKACNRSGRNFLLSKKSIRSPYCLESVTVKLLLNLWNQTVKGHHSVTRNLCRISNFVLYISNGLSMYFWTTQFDMFCFAINWLKMSSKFLRRTIPVPLERARGLHIQIFPAPSIFSCYQNGAISFNAYVWPPCTYGAKDNETYRPSVIKCEQTKEQQTRTFALDASGINLAP